MYGVRLDLDLNGQGRRPPGRARGPRGRLSPQGGDDREGGPEELHAHGRTVTACDGEDPAWKFTVKSGRVTLEDYARLKNATFRLGGIPLLWTPYILWPALRGRASGFLVPGLGYNSNRGGYFGLSYFWAIDRSWDATFSGDFYTQKYYGLGAELRGQPSAGHAVRRDVLHESGDRPWTSGAGRRRAGSSRTTSRRRCAASSRG